MKNNRKVYFYLAATISMLVPVPGRFAFGLLLVILFNCQMATATLLCHAIRRLNMSRLRNMILSCELVAFTILYKQLLIIYCPIAAFTLSWCIYLPALSSVVLDFFFSEYIPSLKEDIAKTMMKSGIMSVCALIYYFFRDLIGYGTITLPAWKKLFVFHLPIDVESVSASSFIATIPGGLIIIAIGLTCYIYIQKRFDRFDRLNSDSSENTGDYSI